METYWIIDYSIKLQSDFHAGAGITLITGNTHGLRLDEQNQPYLPSTQIRGLMRQSGFNMAKNLPDLESIFQLNFPEGATQKKAGGPSTVLKPRGWSYTRAHITGSVSRKKKWERQFHVHINESTQIVQHLFGYEKAGPDTIDDCLELKGRIYSNTPATKKDAAFLLACMRYDDRIGHRRTRGYGKVMWEWNKVQFFTQGSGLIPPKTETLEPKTLFGTLF
jgi:CRISPR/Cas system CSM-associated protein Csm3 (group 7 of RAMP superfamily)